MSTLSDLRAAKDAFFRSSQSPLTPQQRKTFNGLAYFDENPALRIATRLQKYPMPDRISMPTSTGHNADFVKYGWVKFDLDGRPRSLQVSKSEDADGLFVPFMDATTGHETYGSGRYLDLYAHADGTLILDFNQGYNPYCAYNDQWSCPLPPVENRLTVRIEAGEKKYPMHEESVK